MPVVVSSTMIRPAAPFMRSALLTTARAYARRHRIPLRTVSRRAYGDSNFFATVADGGSFTVSKYDAVMAWFADPTNWRKQTIPPGALVDLFEPIASRSSS